MNSLTVRGSIQNWTSQLKEFLERISEIAAADGWSVSFTDAERNEQPAGLGATITYTAPVLVLTRASDEGHEIRITFEPRHRFTIGAAGRIDVYSYPSFREAMLLRVPDMRGAENLTWDEAEERVTAAPWKAFSSERMPLDVDLQSSSSIQIFLRAFVA
jgi:hypothetical protein